MGKTELEFFDTDAVPWSQVPEHPGVSERVLARDPESGLLTRMVRWGPGVDTSSSGAVAHSYFEEVLILSGSIHDLGLEQTFGEGYYACRPPGMVHGPWITVDGCVMLEIQHAGQSRMPERPGLVPGHPTSRRGRSEPPGQPAGATRTAGQLGFVTPQPAVQKQGERMSRFAKINLREVEDSVGARTEGVEGRFARKHLDSRDLGVSLFRYAPNLRSPNAHSHREQEEAYVVVAGSGRILLDSEVQELVQWDVVRVAPEVVRAFEAGPDGLEVIAIGGPKPPEGDGVRAEPSWPDAA